MRKNLRIVFCGLFVAALVVTGVFAAGTRGDVGQARTRGTGTVSRAKTVATPVASRSGEARSARNVVVRASVAPGTSNTSNRADNGSRGRNAINRNPANNAVAPKTSARSATNARAAALPGAARATAVFSDMSKLGEGYNSCREAYNTCMDQFCALANDTYRRCFCSNTFRTLRDKEDALDAATQMLAQFEDNNLNAVDKTAEEVNAMYSATAGEAAIKKDTSAAAALLNDIGDLLSGKKRAENNRNSITSLSGLTIDFSSDMGDIWDMDSNSLFDGGSGVDLSTLEGTELYNNAHSQCMRVVGNSCESNAVKNMAKSAYSVLIAQDCNLYQKKLDTKTEQVKSTVRTAEKYLREARLEEYRTHNSADVNACMDKVETALLQPTACGPNFVKCLDYSGVYINTTTGEPIYSARLFGLNEIIQLDGTADVLSKNTEFNKFLDSKRMYAKTALDSCRDIADTVWVEFKRNALIKIAQAQDEKIEEVKMSCVSTMKECYDTQSDALKSFDDTTAQASGALAARAAKDMCQDKVLACAALYGDSTKCEVDKKTNKVTDKDGGCGLQSLKNFVNTVDDVRIAEGCGTAVENYLKQICTPSSGDMGYPWNCRLKEFGTLSDTLNKPDANEVNGTLVNMVTQYAFENCGAVNGKDNGKGTTLEPRAQAEVVRQLSDLKMELSDMLAQKCEEADGIWSYEQLKTETNNDRLNAYEKFYSSVFGNRKNSSEPFGYCYESNTMAKCISYNANYEKDGDMARYDAARDECVLTDKWYEQHCALLGNGYFENGVCYVAQ